MKKLTSRKRSQGRLTLNFRRLALNNVRTKKGGDEMLTQLRVGKFLLLPAIILTTFLITSVSTARADTITFSTFEQAGTSLVHIGDPYVEAGYRISDGNELWFAQQSNYSYAGSAGLHERISNGLITLSRLNGDTFTLSSIDLSVLVAGGHSPVVVFTGVLAGGGTVTQTFTPVTFGFTTFTFNS